MWRIACACGQVFEGVPPVACPKCEDIIEDPAEMRDELIRITHGAEGEPLPDTSHLKLRHEPVGELAEELEL